MKRIPALALVLAMVLPGLSSAQLEKTFPDLDKPGVYAKDEINILYDEGILTGYKDGTFKPFNKITRQEFAKILTPIIIDINIEEATNYCNEKFDDVDSWAKPYVGALAQRGIVEGKGERRFGASDYLTREQMVALIIRAMGIEQRASAAAEHIQTDFSDINNCSDYAKDDVRFAKAISFIKGVNGNNFLPKETAQRQAVARLMYELHYNGTNYIPNMIRVELSNVTDVTPWEAGFIIYRVTFANSNLVTNPFTFTQQAVTSGDYLAFEDYQNSLGINAADWGNLTSDEKNSFAVDCLATWSLEGFPYQLTGIENPEGALITGVSDFFSANPDKVLTEEELLNIAGSSNVLNIPG